MNNSFTQRNRPDRTEANETGSFLADGRRSIYWLASYPKSGNTWTRILLSNLVWPDSRSATIMSGDRSRFEKFAGLSSSDLTDDEIDLLRPDVFRAMALEKDQLLSIKVHDAFHFNLNGEAIFPADCSLGIIYLVRHPMDVAVSYAHHKGHENYSEIVALLNAKDHSMAGRQEPQLRQRTLGWTGHYRSWHNQSEIPILTIKYEDMLQDTTACLTNMVKFMHLDKVNDDASIADAVEQSRFTKLQAKEDEFGFAERPKKSKRFFRSGRAGEGAEKLSDQLQKQILDANYDLMMELSYD